MGCSESAKYVGWALQICLLIGLVVALSCKSWALLGACLGAAVVLLVIVATKLIRGRLNQIDQPPPYRNNVQLLQKSFLPHQMTSLPPQPQIMYPRQDIRVPMSGNHGYTGFEPYVPMDERMAMTMNSFTNRGQMMHAPHKAITAMRRSSGLSQGEEPIMDKYMVPIPGAIVKTPQYGLTKTPNSDPDDPQNPLNRLSYLYGR